MMFKNSFKLLMAKFSTLWELLLYYIIVCAILFALIFPFSSTIMESLQVGGHLDKLYKCAINFNVSVNLFSWFKLLYVSLVGVFFNFLAMFSTHTFLAIYISIVVFYVMPFLFGLAKLPLEESLFGYMSSLTRYGFFHSFIRKFSKSARLSLFKTLICLPINLLFVYIFSLTLKVTNFGAEFAIASPFIAVAVMCILASLKTTIFAGWVPACVVYNCNMFVGLGKGFKAVFRRFWRAFSTALVMMIIIFAVNYLFSSFAFIINIPVSIMLLNIFEMVMFYGSQGMRYYVDLDTIVTPKKLEEIDSFRKIKDII